DKVGMPGHIDDTDDEWVPASVGSFELKFGETQFDRHAPALFLGEPVGVRPREGHDQRTFAMVDMAGGSEDEVAGWHAGMMRQPVSEVFQRIARIFSTRDASCSGKTVRRS